MYDPWIPTVMTSRASSFSSDDESTGTTASSQLETSSGNFPSVNTCNDDIWLAHMPHFLDLNKRHIAQPERYITENPPRHSSYSPSNLGSSQLCLAVQLAQQPINQGLGDHIAIVLEVHDHPDLFEEAIVNNLSCEVARVLWGMEMNDCPYLRAANMI
ncbi:uncharacterized protein N7458_004147 [Penicillium daleae]|uniref:Uncharacterized protein n=1 Tax=Penicillium daleae TaxID=63821 RepID=A0AAD6CBH1_9EURO|nr:uncharacterized protein N7458_004147 [Penicillium daleae]KAJ5455883.1 hypothetical protein N7458_004147 [Penicillium daleae]